MLGPKLFANSFVLFIKHPIWLLFVSLASFYKLNQHILLLENLIE